MRIYVSIDMEGIAGVVRSDHTSTAGRDYNLARKWMTKELSVVVDEALKNGVEYILVNDSHGGMTNLLLDELPEGNIEVITGSLKPLIMMEGIQLGFNAAFFIGYHSKKGTRGGILDHTVFGRAFRRVVINNREASEFYLNALIAGHYNTPVVLLSGDDKIAKEARETIDGIEVVVTKYGISRYSARHLTKSLLYRRLREATQRALGKADKVKPLKISYPVKIEIEFTDSSLADAAELIPIFNRIDAMSIEYKARDMVEAVKLIEALCLISSAVLR